MVTNRDLRSDKILEATLYLEVAVSKVLEVRAEFSKEGRYSPTLSATGDSLRESLDTLKKLNGREG